MNKAELKTAMEATNKWKEVSTLVLSPTSRITGFLSTTKLYEIPTLRVENNIIINKVFVIWVFDDEGASEEVFFVDQDPLNSEFTVFKAEVETYMNALNIENWYYRDINVIEEWAMVRVFTLSATNPTTHMVQRDGIVFKDSGSMAHRIIE